MLEELENNWSGIIFKYAIFENSLMDSLMDIVLSNETRGKLIFPTIRRKQHPGILIEMSGCIRRATAAAGS